MSGRRLVPVFVILMLAASACSPPKFLRDLIRRKPPQQSTNLAPPPDAPPSPSPYFLGVIQVTYSGGWDSVISTQRVPGALILDVLPNSVASEVGLKRGDIIVRIDEEEIRNRTQVPTAFKLSSDPKHHIVVAKPDGRTQGIDVTLRPPAENSTLDYLERRLTQSPDPINQYLVAFNIADFARALSLLDSAIDAAPTFAPAYAQKALKMHQQAEGLPAEERQSQREVINEILKLAAQHDPDSSEVHSLSARISLEFDDAISAETDALIAVEFDQLSAEAHYLLGRTRMEQGRAADGFDDLRTAVGLDPYAIEYYGSLAYCYRLLSHPESARTTIEAAKTLTDDQVIIQQLDDVLERSI